VLLRQISLSHYRCFRDSQSIEFGRFTLLYGRNSAGKSALLRLPALLARSMSGPPGLLVADAVTNGASFRELCWRGGRDGELLGLGLELESGRTWRWELEWSEGLGEGALRTVEGPRGGQPCAMTWVPKRGAARSDQRTFATPDGEQVDTIVSGLVPEKAGFDGLDELRALGASVQWLGASRLGPSREGVALGRRPSAQSAGGEWAEALVASDERLRERVSSWYRENAQAELVISAPENNVRVRLRHVAEASPDVPFPDVGEGLQQVFPLLVAVERLREAGGMLCVEEPESHLHPALQRMLAERIIDVLCDNPRAQVVVETHSEVFLYAALFAAVSQLRGDVAIHWVASGADGASLVKLVELDDNGRPVDQTLERAFDAMGVLRRDLIAERRAHAG